MIVVLLPQSLGASLQNCRRAWATWPWAALGHCDARVAAPALGGWAELVAVGIFLFPKVFSNLGSKQTCKFSINLCS